MKAISGEILTRSRRDSRAMKDDLGEICNFSEIAMRSRRDLVKNSARFVMSLRSARDESDLGRDTDEISPRVARDERYFCETNKISPI